MINVKEEIIAVLVEEDYSLSDVEAIELFWVEDGGYKKAKVPFLSISRSVHKNEFESIFETKGHQLYNNGYGSQLLYGTIWMKDGTWFDRGEYDGSEWWEYRRRPEIPENLKEISNV